jgi:hypothetical protein
MDQGAHSSEIAAAGSSTIFGEILRPDGFRAPLQWRRDQHPKVQQMAEWKRVATLVPAVAGAIRETSLPLGNTIARIVITTGAGSVREKGVIRGYSTWLTIPHRLHVD